MDHQRVEVRFEQERFGPKADVCWECSDPEDRVWVPVTFCASASRTMPGWGEADMELGFYTVPNAPSMWDEPEYDALERWDQYDPDACWRGRLAA